MTFDEMLAQMVELLQREGRVTYRALKRRFALDDDYLEDLKGEIIKAKRLAVDEDGEVLVWIGVAPVQGSEFQVPSSSQSPAPSHQPPDALRPTLYAPRTAEGERRQLTVMFCDLVGSTALSEQLDPEELREVVRAYHETCAGVISRYAGHTAQHLGDGLLVYFGHPAAHEDDAQRAVRTGLEILAGLQSLNAQLPPTIRARLPHPIQVRIGVHTGLVVIGEIGSSEKREILALGETPNIAARVQGVAEPDTLVISIATQQLVAGLFECQNLGPQTLKGISTPLSVYRVICENEAQSRFEVAVQKGLTPLVGRAEELALLQRRWEQTTTGEGQVVLLSGEPGIGKSRLVQTLREQIMAEEATYIELRCSPYHQNSAFYPITEHLQRFLGFQREEAPQAKLTKLQQALTRYHFPQGDTVPLLAALLSLPHPEGLPPLTLSPRKQKQKTQEAVVAWLCEEAERQAVYNVWEDLHWADPSTLELLTLYFDHLPTTQLLALLTFRPDFHPPWQPCPHITPLTLNRLGHPQVEAMVARVTGGKVFPSEVLHQIVAKTDGVPLFVEELTKMVLESGLLRAVNNHYELTGPLPPLAIPSTLQDSLMARLDRLALVREVAQVGATLGREFSYELLRAVSPLDEENLQQGLGQLVEAELLYQRELPPQATYLFKHALIQDAAYQSLLKSKRRQLHQQIAQVLEGRFTQTTETQPELLAHHYTEAGLLAQAIPYWQRAGQSAAQRSAHVEAISHLTKGLELLKASPDSPERLQRELDLQLLLGPVLMNTKGQAAPETGAAFRRAYEISQNLGDSPRLFSALAGLRRFYSSAAELPTAREVAQQMLTIAQRERDPALLVEAHHALGNVLFRLGEFAAAQAQVEQGIAVHDPQRHRSLAFLHGLDPGVQCRNFASHVLWFLGYPDQALQRSAETLTLARELAHPYSLVYALYFATEVHQFQRKGPAVQERAKALIKLCTEHGFAALGESGAIIRSWVLVKQGEKEDWIARMYSRDLIAWRAQPKAEWYILRPYLFALVAEMCAEVGELEEGMTMLAEAFAAVEKGGERWWEAELYRLKGELTLAQSSIQKEAEECFQKAIEVARRQQAKSLELRATVSLARLWQQQGKKAEACQILAEIYGWFTEGFDTADLKDAKALLEELSERGW